MKRHKSDCAMHNDPAYPNGPCNCQDKWDEMGEEIALRYNGSNGLARKISEALRLAEGVGMEMAEKVAQPMFGDYGADIADAIRALKDKQP
jgi:hypothetical protein